MKKIIKAATCLVLTIGLLSSFAYAGAVVTRASLYLSDYSASISADQNGTISISATVYGNGYLSKIGVSKVTVYESLDGKSYTKYGTFFSDDYPSMMSSGTQYRDTVFQFTGVVGRTYKATVYCYGSDGSGSDEKPCFTDRVTAKR